jgi:transposase InsO family protein
MRVHPNAKTTPKGRALIVQRVDTDGWTAAATAAAFGVSVRTVHKWRARYRGEGLAGLADRSAAPQQIPHRTAARREARIVALRAERLTGLGIAHRLGMARATVGAVLRRHGLGRLPALSPAEPVRRYEREHPGELLHLDIESLGRIGRVRHRIHGDRRRRARGIGWEHVHVCIDDASRGAYVEVLPTRGHPDAVGFLDRAVVWFAQHGVHAERVLTDNGSAYVSQAFAAACTRLGLRHHRTRPYRPRPNGSRALHPDLAAGVGLSPALRDIGPPPPGARFVAPLLNRKRPHTSLNYRAPITRLQEIVA